TSPVLAATATNAPQRQRSLKPPPEDLPAKQSLRSGCGSKAGGLNGHLNDRPIDGRSRLTLVERTATLFAFVLYDDTQSHHGHSGAPRPSEPGHLAGGARAGLP